MTAVPISSRYHASQMLPLEPHECSAGTPYGLQWWVSLLFFGKSAPIPDDHVAHTKWRWMSLTRDRRKELIEAAEKRLEELRSSTADILARLAVLAVVAAIGIQPVQSLLGHTTVASAVFAWLTLALIGISIVSLVAIVTPKLKVWAPQKQFVDRVPTMLELIEDEALEWWPNYLRLTRKIEHRRQLIRLERRLQVVGGAATVLSLATLALSIAYN